MTGWIQCVPNFSEGRDPATLRALCEAVEQTAGACLLDSSADADHNRAVLTLAGEPAAAGEAVLAVARVAVERIDLRRHEGAHPRIGALDVAPFVPLEKRGWEAAIAAAHRLGERLWEELRVPAYFYGRAALRPERERLEHVRRGGFEGLRAAALENPARRPDVGGPALHPSAGAAAVGARTFLIAFNVNLRTRDIAVARAIARTIRESSGGYRAVKALGLALSRAGLTQVSMNLTDYAITSPSTVYRRIREEAAAAGVEVAGSELIGLIPAAALEPLGPEGLGLRDFSANRILENRLRAVRGG